MKLFNYPPMIVRTYSIVTEESAQDGDFAENGWADFSGNQFPIDHDKPGTIHFDLSIIGHDCTPDEYDVEDGRTAVDNAVKFLEDDCYVSESSSSHFDVGAWYSASPESDYSTGDETTYNYHLEGFTPEQEEQIFMAIKGAKQ